MHLRVLEKEEVECGDVLALLGEYVDEELPRSLKERIDSHFLECSQCAEMLTSYRQVVALAGELEPEPIPDEAKQRLRLSLNRRLGLNLPVGG